MSSDQKMIEEIRDEVMAKRDPFSVDQEQQTSILIELALWTLQGKWCERAANIHQEHADTLAKLARLDQR